MTDTEPTNHQPEPDTNRRTAVLIYILYLVGFATGITTIAGVVIAHSKVDSVPDPWRSHLQYQIRTFWVGLLIGVIGWVTMIFLVGILVLFLLPLWFLIRCIKGIIAANENRPIEDPQTWLW